MVAQTKLVKLALTKQIDQTQLEEKTKRQIEIEQELQDSNLVKAKYLEDQESVKQQKKDAAKHFKEIWEAQRELREQTSAVDRVF